MYETARTDLLELEREGLLRKLQRGRKMVFLPAEDLVARIERLHA